MDTDSSLWKKTLFAKERISNPVCYVGYYAPASRRGH